VWGAVTSTYLDENNVYHGYLRNPDGGYRGRRSGCGQRFNAGHYPIALNDFGVITGFYFDSNNVIHGFLRRPDGTLSDFDAPVPIRPMLSTALNPRV
jgi:cell envelope opacity-associated protein A